VHCVAQLYSYILKGIVLAPNPNYDRPIWHSKSNVTDATLQGRNWERTVAKTYYWRYCTFFRLCIYVCLEENSQVR